MIVQCDKCRTKFRIADEKVTDAGVKVRCSRCAHVFMVRRSDIADPSAMQSALPRQDIERSLREAGLDGAPSIGLGVAGLPDRSQTIRMGGSAGVPTHAGTHAGTQPGRLDMSAYAPVAPDSTLGPAFPGTYPVPSLMPEPAPRSQHDTMVALGFAAPDPNAEPETVIAPIPPMAPGRSAGSLARELDFEDDPTHTHSATAPLDLGSSPPVQKSAPGAGTGFDDLMTRRYPLPPFGAASNEPVLPQAANPFAPPPSAQGVPTMSSFAPASTAPSMQSPFPAPSSSGELDFGDILPKPPTNPSMQAISPFPKPPTNPNAFGKPGSNPNAFGKSGSNPNSAFGAGSNPIAAFGMPGSNPNAFGMPGSNPNAGFGMPGSNPNAAGMSAANPSAFGMPGSNPNALFGPAGIDPGGSTPQPAPRLASLSPADFGALPSGAGNPLNIPMAATLAEPRPPLGSLIPPFGTNPTQPNAQSPAVEPGFEEAPQTNPLFPPPPNLAALIAAAGASLEPQQQAPQSGDIPGLLPPGATGGDDPFAGLDLDGGGTGTGTGSNMLTGNDLSSLPQGSTPFDDEQARSTFPVNKPGEAHSLARIDLKGGASSGPGSAAAFGQAMATTRVSTALAFPGRDRTSIAPYANPRAYGRWPTIAGLVIGFAVTIAAVIGPAGGDLSKLGIDDIQALYSGGDAPATISEALPDIRARGAHVTTYTTGAGKKLLVVAGEALNEGAEAFNSVEAVAIVLDDGAVVDRRQALVGLELQEDALVAVTSPQDLDAAYARAEKRQEHASTLKPGSTLPFMVVFPDVPAALDTRTFQVEFRRANRQPSAASP